MTASTKITVLGVYERVETKRGGDGNGDISSSSEAIFARRRIDTTSAAAAPRFVPQHGLVSSSFYHNTIEEHEEKPDVGSDKHGEVAVVVDAEGFPVYKQLNDPGRIYEERAILLQSLDHYQELMAHHTSSSSSSKSMDSIKSVNNNETTKPVWFPDLLGTKDHRLDSTGSPKESHSQQQQQQQQQQQDAAEMEDLCQKIIPNDPRFGEQIIVQGCHAKSICIGDILVFCENEDTVDEFYYYDGKSESTPATTSPLPLVVQVTSPRLACSKVDRKNGSPFGSRGLRRHVNTWGLGGFFCRVLQPGIVRDGMTLVRQEQRQRSNDGDTGKTSSSNSSSSSHKWTLQEVAHALYGECDTKHHNLNKPQWNRSKEELEELCALEPLAWLEWKAEAQWILDRWERGDGRRGYSPSTDDPITARVYWDQCKSFMWNNFSSWNGTSLLVTLAAILVGFFAFSRDNELP